MRTTLAVIGVILIILGLVSLGFQSITFFTHERVVDAGPLQIDLARPHTIILNPIVGVVAVVVGLILLLSARRSGPV
jgi:hypothetical protein